MTSEDMSHFFLLDEEEKNKLVIGPSPSTIFSLPKQPPLQFFLKSRLPLASSHCPTCFCVPLLLVFIHLSHDEME